MRTLEPTIAEHPFFRGLDAKHLELIASCAMNVRFEAGEFQESEPETSEPVVIPQRRTGRDINL